MSNITPEERFARTLNAWNLLVRTDVKMRTLHVSEDKPWIHGDVYTEVMDTRVQHGPRNLIIDPPPDDYGLMKAAWEQGRL